MFEFNGKKIFINKDGDYEEVNVKKLKKGDNDGEYEHRSMVLENGRTQEKRP